MSNNNYLFLDILLADHEKSCLLMLNGKVNIVDKIVTYT
jgi:hypothetical protein